jgi:hypothetical protein
MIRKSYGSFHSTKDYLDWASKILGNSKIDDWYGIKLSDFLALPASQSVAIEFDNSLPLMIYHNYTDRAWNLWMFKETNQVILLKYIIMKVNIYIGLLF